MIILRRPNVGAATTVRLSDPLSGDKNGSNQVFTTTYNYVSDRISVLYNGQALHSPDDFIESGFNEITLVSLIPDSTDELRANYEVLNSCTISGVSYITAADHSGIAHYFTGLVDTPNSYVGGAGRVIAVNPAGTGLEFGTLVSGTNNSFIGLNDVPTTYSGHEGEVLQVNSTGTGLEYGPVSIEGGATISGGVSSINVTFSSELSSSNYTVLATLENTVDSSPSVYSFLISSKTTTGFNVLFSGDIDSSNYVLNWIVKT